MELAVALAAIAGTHPDEAQAIREALAARRLREDLADAEALLREQARTDRSRTGRALTRLLEEYDARAGRAPQAPAAERTGRTMPTPSFSDPNAETPA